ncbi:MAG: hypothetical protein ABDH28_06140 [Brevinematia bacterium]
MVVINGRNFNKLLNDDLPNNNLVENIFIVSPILPPDSVRNLRMR